MLLNKLESGFLVLQTQQGSVAVEPSSFWQRIYLLWTFRNFHELSPLLLNARQTALINNLFLQHAAAISREYEPSLQIGVVEDFVPPAIEIGAPLGAKTDGSLAVKATLPQPRAGQYLAPPAMPIAAAPAMKADGAPAVKNEEAEMEATVIDRAEIAPRDALDRAFAPIIYWNRAFAPIIYCLRLASRNRSTSRPPAPRLQLSRVVIYGLAAAIGALSLCAGFMVAFHRTGPIPGPQSHSSPRQLNSPDSPSPPGPTSVAENPSVVPEVPPQPDAVRDAAVEAASPKATSSTTTTHRMMSPKRKSRGATSRVASRSSGGSHAVAISRVPGRTASAPGSRGAMTRSAQRYFHLADQQMHKGNYAAAAANYKRAWRIEENSAAAKGRLARARRAMQAENESIAPPH